MEQVQKARALEVEEGAVAAVRVAGAGMPPVPAETVYARVVAKKSHITWEHPVMNSNVPSAGPP